MADDVPAMLVGVFAVSGLTDWERDRLAGLEEQLIQEDPRLAARLGRPATPYRSWGRRGGWLMSLVGVVLFVCGPVLQDAAVTLSGYLLLSLCWAPVLLAGHSSAQPDS